MLSLVFDKALVPSRKAATMVGLECAPAHQKTVNCRLDPVSNLKLGQNIFHMALHCGRTDLKTQGNFCVGLCTG